MSEVAGALATQMGAWALKKGEGGTGTLSAGCGRPAARVVVLGGGIVCYNAARSRSACRRTYGSSTGRSSDAPPRDDARWADHAADVEPPPDRGGTAGLRSVIGAVLIPGAPRPKLVRRDMLARMKPGSALVDAAIDQGGCFETDGRPPTRIRSTRWTASSITVAVCQGPFRSRRRKRPPTSRCPMSRGPRAAGYREAVAEAGR